MLNKLNLTALASVAGALFIVGAVSGFFLAGKKSAEDYAATQARAVQAEHSLNLEKIGRKLIAKDQQIDGLKSQLRQALLAAEAEAKIITKIQKVEVIRDQAIHQARADDGLNGPVDPAALRILIDLYDRLCGEAQASACAGGDTGAGDGQAGHSPGDENKVSDTAPARDRDEGRPG